MGQHDIDADALPYAIEKLPRKEDVGAEAFFALDLRAGRVTAVEEFPEARQPSWKVTVDFGPIVGELRTAAKITNYKRADLEGRMVVGAINLGPRRIAGFRSEFLILGALEPDGTVRLLGLEEGVAPGSSIA